MDAAGVSSFRHKATAAHIDTGRANCWGYGLFRVWALAEELHFDLLERSGAFQGALPGIVRVKATLGWIEETAAALEAVTTTRNA
jgi:hypothetical protein